MNVLLIEPVRHELPNVALMKISTMHKLKGDKVKFCYSAPYFIDFNPDIIYVSTIFTWEFHECVDVIKQLKGRFPNAQIRIGGISASLLARMYENETGIAPFVGLWDEIEQYKPDYSLFPDMDYSIVLSTRGCVNKCAFCMVHKLEPQFIEIENWWKHIDMNKSKIVFFDNNFFASSKKHFDNVMDMLEMLDKDVDFNQGLDSRIFCKTPYIAERMSRIKIHPLRFAWDGPQENTSVPDSIKLAFEHGTSDISVYMLYNFMDTPEEIYMRMKTMAGMEANGYRGNKVYIFPMKYQPLNTLVKSDYVGEHWTEDMLWNFSKMRNSEFVNGILRFNNIEHVERVFGKDEHEFAERLRKEIKVVNNFREVLHADTEDDTVRNSKARIRFVEPDKSQKGLGGFV